MTTPVRGVAMHEVEVGPFRVADTTRAELVELLVQRSLEPRTVPLTAFALHVGGVNSRSDKAFLSAMRKADVVYADGGSVVWLARLSGARRIQRAPTTDLGWELLRGLTDELGRPPRVALVGGHEGLAEGAGAVLEQAGAAGVVFTTHGFHADWEPVLAALRDTDPEVCIVGLGAPGEMVWATEHGAELPGGVVLTCGGWFGYLTGDERRAPRFLRRAGLEWLARIAQAPTRLAPRYARGVLSTASLSISTILMRVRWFN